MTISRDYMPSVFLSGGTRDLAAPPGAFAHVAEIENRYCQKHSWRVSGGVGGGCVSVCVWKGGEGRGGGRGRGVYGHVVLRTSDSSEFR